MDVPAPRELLERVRALPAGAPLTDRLGGAGGVYLVGGSVRDLLLGGRPLDLDIVVDGDAAGLGARLGGEVLVHDRFGTSTVRLGGFSYDIARARRETYRHSGALPDVALASLEEDLLRRDFTINSLAIALTGSAAGRLYAAPGALEDLEGRRLRVLHDGSFRDDPTRMLRLARYASRLEFSIDPHTRTLAQEAIATDALATVSGSRIGAELRLLAGEPDPVAALRCLAELRLDRGIHPRFGLRDERLARRALAVLPGDGRRDRLAIALAALDLGADELTALLDALAFEAPDREAIVAAATRAPELAERLERARLPSQVAAAADGAGPELVALAGAIGPERQARDWLTRLRHVGLEIDGSDLLAAGVPQGPLIGRGLRAALAAKLDGRAWGREEELTQALQAARSSG
jgi:tRNA nucleotidyltransferase (CCA-adding enzyme)